MKKGYEKRFNNADIVYFHRQIGNDHSVCYGIVDEQFSDAVCIDFLETKEIMLVNGIPVEDFQSETKYHKLPKGWTFDTKLYELSFRRLWAEDYISSDITDPTSIKRLYDDGYLVKASTKFHGVIDAEITNEGYRVVKRYPQWEHVITSVSVRPDRVYNTYAEAQEEVNEYIAELKFQASLDDTEWSIYQIDKTLTHYKRIADVSDGIIKKYHNWLCSMKDVDQIETRIFSGEIQWKYEKNKKWNNIEYADVMRS